MQTRIEVEALLGLIRDSAMKALDEYERDGSPVPSLQSTNGHPLDQSQNNIQFMKTIAILEGACEQLCSTLAPPAKTILNRVQDYQYICMHTVVRHKVADELAKHEHGMHVRDLSAALSLHPAKLSSILRSLATKHCFCEISPNVFANNRLSAMLLSSHPMASAVLYSSDKHEYIRYLPEYLADTHIGHSSNINETAFQYFIKERYPDLGAITFYQWMELPINHTRREALGKAMIGINDVLGGLSAVHAFDWTRVNTVCDVGGGLGHFAQAILSINDMLKVMIFDLPKTIEVTKLHWKSQYSERVSFCAGDFFHNVPAQGYDVYYMRNILHNWADEQCAIILSNVYGAMSSQSRLLIHDPVLRPLYRIQTNDTDGPESAPEPLLANYGAGYIQLHNSDITMMALCNSRDRYLSELTALASSAGLCLLKVYDLSTTYMLEFSKL